MSSFAETHSKKYLLVANELYPSIIQEFLEIEKGKVLDAIHSERLLNKIKKAIFVLKQIDTSTLSTILDNEKIQIINKNINFMYEELAYIQKRLTADQYVDDLQVPVRRYIKNIVGDPSNYKKWAKNPEELANKFIGMLLHPDNIETYRNQIKRMALGTMSLREFQKIFNAAKHKMIPLREYNFKSFSDYTKKRKSNTIQYKP